MRHLSDMHALIDAIRALQEIIRQESGAATELVALVIGRKFGNELGLGPGCSLLLRGAPGDLRVTVESETVDIQLANRVAVLEQVIAAAHSVTVTVGAPRTMTAEEFEVVRTARDSIAAAAIGDNNKNPALKVELDALEAEILGDNCGGGRCLDIAELATRWGRVEGEHHLRWLIDQILRSAVGDDRYEKIIGTLPGWSEGVAP